MICDVHMNTDQKDIFFYLAKNTEKQLNASCRPAVSCKGCADLTLGFLLISHYFLP